MIERALRCGVIVSIARSNIKLVQVSLGTIEAHTVRCNQRGIGISATAGEVDFAGSRYISIPGDYKAIASRFSAGHI